MLAHLKLNSGKLDIDYPELIVKDTRQFYREVNILQKALNQSQIKNPQRTLKFWLSLTIQMKCMIGVLNNHNIITTT